MKKTIYKSLGWSLETTFTPIINASYKLTTISSFLAAVHHNDLAYLKLLVEKLQFDLKQRDKNGRTLLHQISTENLNYYQSHYFYTNNTAIVHEALCNYIAAGKYEALKLLLSEKAVDLNQLYREKTPLQLAVTSKNYHDDWTRINIIKLLLNHGAYPNMRQYPLLSACYEIYKDQSVPIIEVLCSYGANTALSFHTEPTLLFEAALAGNEKLVTLLIKLGVSPHAKEQYRVSLYEKLTTDSTDFFALNMMRQVTPYIRALISKSTKPKEQLKFDLEDIIAFLKMQGLDLNAQDSQGNAPLHLANSYTKFEALLVNNAEVNLTNAEQETPLHVAVRKNFYDRRLGKLLQEKGANINARDMNGFTSLRKSIHLKDLSFATEYLLQHGADFTITDKQGITPFVVTIVEKKSSLMKQFIEKKVDVNEYSSHYQCYPIHLALDPKYYDFTVMKYLVGANASLLSKNAQGQNAFNIVKANLDNYKDYGFKTEFYQFCRPKTYDNGRITVYGDYANILDIPHLQYEKDKYGLDRLMSYRKPFIAKSKDKLECSDIFRNTAAEILAQLLMQIISESLEEEFRYLLSIDLIKDHLSLWQLLLDEKKPTLQKAFISYVKKQGDIAMLHDMLRIAVIDTDVEMVTYLLQDEVLQKKINNKDEHSKTILHEAILNIEIHLKEINKRYATENYKYHKPDKPIKKPGKIGIQDTAKTIELLVVQGADVNISYKEKSPLYYVTKTNKFDVSEVIASIVTTLLKAQADVEPVRNLLFNENTSAQLKHCFCKFFIQQKQWKNLFLVIEQCDFYFDIKKLCLTIEEIKNFYAAITQQPITPRLNKIINELVELYESTWHRDKIIEQTITGKYKDVEGFPCREKLKTIRNSNNWTQLFKHKTSEAMLLANDPAPKKRISNS